MILHTVQNGDTVFSIARKYGISPMKLIENNELANPDELSIGEELLILSPTRTYTVRGGDTLDRISRTFGVKKSKLQAANPALMGTDRLYPGELLAIRYDAPPYGMAAVNGYVYRDTSEDALMRALPYLTYVTVSSACTDGRQVRMLFDDTASVRLIRERGRIALLRVCETDGMPTPEQLRTAWEHMTDALIRTAKERGYGGITLAFYETAAKNPALYNEFVVYMRGRLLGCDLILFTETDANRRLPLGDYADGAVLMYEKASLPTPPSFADGEQTVAEHYAAECESSRMFLDISPFGYDGSNPLTLQQIRKLAYKHRAPIEHDVDKKLCFVRYPYFSGGAREEHTVVFESLENIKAKLHLCDALGYMGVSVDVGRTPVAVFMMLHTLFCDAEYTFFGTGG